jgi:hypothetical protein
MSNGFGPPPPRVVHQNCQPAELLRHPFDHCHSFRLVGHVQLQPDRLDAELAALGRHRFGVGRFQVGDGDHRSGLGEQEAYGLTDPGPTASDECCLSVQ